MIKAVNFSIPQRQNYVLKSINSKQNNVVSSSPQSNAKVSSELLKAYNNVVSFKGSDDNYYDFFRQEDAEMIDYIKRQNEFFADENNIQPNIEDEAFNGWSDVRVFSPFPAPNTTPEIIDDYFDEISIQEENNPIANIFNGSDIETSPTQKTDNFLKNMEKIGEVRPDVDGIIRMLVATSPCFTQIMELAKETNNDGTPKYNLDDISTFAGFKCSRDLNKYLEEQ